MLLYHLSSGSGGMADALDSGSSGSLSCESSSLFFRIIAVILVITAFLFFCVADTFGGLASCSVAYGNIHKICDILLHLFR